MNYLVDPDLFFCKKLSANPLYNAESWRNAKSWQNNKLARAVVDGKHDTDYNCFEVGVPSTRKQGDMRGTGKLVGGL